MGNRVGRAVVGQASKPVRDWNIEERAHKAVLANRYTPSPNHPGTRELIDDTIAKLPPEARKELERTSEDFGKRLQDVYVTSQDKGVVETPPRATPSRPLPKERRQPLPWEYGHRPPAVTPYGKLTLKDALAIVSQHADTPESPGVVALKYKLDTKQTEALLRYFGTYRLITPVEAHAKGPINDLGDQLTPGAPEVLPSEVPNTERTRRMLSGVAMRHWPSPSDSFIPSEKVVVPTEHPDNTDPADTRTLMNPGSEEEFEAAEEKIKSIFSRRLRGQHEQEGKAAGGAVNPGPEKPS